MSVFVQEIEQDYSKQFDALERHFDIDITRLYSRAIYESNIEMIEGEYTTEASDDSQPATVDDKGENLLQKIITKIKNFISGFLDAVSNLFKSKEHVDLESYLASNTGQMEMEYDLQKIQQNLDSEMLKGRKLVQKISSATGVDDAEVANFCDTAARAIQKHGKTILKVGVTFALFKAMTSKFRDKDREVSEMYDRVKIIKDPKKKAQAAKVLNAMASLIKDGVTVGGITATALASQRKKDDKNQEKAYKQQMKEDKKQQKAEAKASKKSKASGEETQ